MKRSVSMVVLLSTLSLAGCDDDDDEPASPSGGATTTMSFFVSSTTSTTGNLGGLSGADARCQSLAAAAGFGSKQWRAYLSTENPAIDARSRIGAGPWYNAKNVLLASNLDELHARKGDAELFLDEKGQKINGQWAGSPTPNQHDILTGSTAEGRVQAGMTCADWTSNSASIAGQVGHSDGLGPNMGTTGTLTSWNSAHASASCADTAPRGGAGRVYCFATN